MSHHAEKAMIRLTIDGQEVEIEAGSTIIQAAEKLGIKIPTMCYLKKVSTTGACRVCLVQVEGVERPVTACNTIATAGIVVTTSTPELERQRKDMIRLLLVNHPLDCPVCDAAGQCDLQDICFDHHVLDQPYRALDVAMPKVTGWPLIEHVPSRCVLCEKCVKVGHELTGIGDFFVNERGDKAFIDRKPGQNDIDPYIEGNAVAVCPVGAMISKPFKHSSRSWTLEKVPSLSFSGGSLEQVDLNVKNNRLYRITSQDEVTRNDGLLSFDASFAYGFVHAPERLSHPMVAGVQSDWDTALRHIAAKVRELGGAAVAGLASARLTLEENYLFQKLFRVAFKSNNIDSAARFGQQAVYRTLAANLGLQGGSAPIESIATADAIVVFGSDISAEQPMVNAQIQKACRRNDAYLVVANMRRVRIAGHSHVFLNYRPGSENALLAALCRLLFDRGQADNAWIKQQVQNAGDIKKLLAKVDVAAAAAQAGVELDLLVEAADKLAAAGRVALIFGRDISQSGRAAELTAGLADLAILSGALQGAGVFPVDERPNSQGLLDAGVCPEQLPGYQDYATNAARFAKAWQVQALPEGGLNAIQMLEAIEAGKIRMLYLAAVNPLVTFPDSARWKKALKQLDLLVVQDILASELTEMAQVVLPACSFAEKSGSFVACDQSVGLLQPALAPLGQSRSDKQIFAQLFAALTSRPHTQDDQQILAEMASLTDLFERVGVEGARYRIPAVKKGWQAGKLQFAAIGAAVPQQGLCLLTGKMHAHTGVTSTYAAAACEIAPAGYIEISCADAAVAGIAEGDRVCVAAGDKKIEGPARLSSYVPAGLLFAPYHFAQLNAQSLLPLSDNLVTVTLAKA